MNRSKKRDARWRFCGATPMRATIAALNDATDPVWRTVLHLWDNDWREHWHTRRYSALAAQG